MKHLFPGLYRPSEEQLKSLWTNGTFILDTNVLLNLYSYPESARDIFLSVLEKVSDRTWIPFQVALEFHRNRFSRIKQSNEPLFKLRDRIRTTSDHLEAEIRAIEFEKRNTGVDDLSSRLQTVKEANNQLAEALDRACERLPSISLNDPIAEKIAKLFEKRVGAPPENQEEIDSLVKDGLERYERKTPPGYKDLREKKEIVYYDRNIKYHAMFGDLILWRQVMNYVRDAQLEHVIFVTGDRKEDWWNTIDGKTLGPSPDLVQEFTRVTGVKNFWMYTADQFLEHAETRLSATEVTEETIQQVKETSNQNDIFIIEWKANADRIIPDPQSKKSIFATRNFKVDEKSLESFLSKLTSSDEKLAESAFRNWVQKYHGSKDFLSLRFPEIALDTSDGIFGYEIFHEHTNILRRLKNKVDNTSKFISKGSFPVSLAIILHDDFDEDSLENYAMNVSEIISDSLIDKVIIGEIHNEEFLLIRILRNPST